METLRRVQRLTCQLLLVWFALSVGAAIASPILTPHSSDVVCSGAGTLMLMPADDGNTGAPGDHQHECHLCVMVGVPPVPVVFAAHDAPAQTPFVALPVPVARQSPAPFQQRGPPLV
jgi:hypothetical protein